MKELICTVAGVIGSAIAYLFGGWDTGFITLFIFIVLDYVSGMVVAGVFKKSKKTESGALSSYVGFKGICKKGMVLLFVLVAYRLDLILGTSYIRDAVIIAFITNELISLIENAKLMGVPLPAILSGAIDLLQKTSEKKEDV